jgi:hypothetical protein
MIGGEALGHDVRADPAERPEADDPVRGRPRSGPAGRHCPPTRGSRAVEVEAHREDHVELHRERRHRPFILADVDREDDEIVVRMDGGEAGHRRELVATRRAVRGHEVDPDRLPAQGGQVDRPATELGHDEGRRRATGPEETLAIRRHRVRGRRPGRRGRLPGGRVGRIG